LIGVIDSSVFLAQYLGEERSGEASNLMGMLSDAVVSRIAEIEVRRGLSLVVSAVERVTAEAFFTQQRRVMNVVDVDAEIAAMASEVAVKTRVRSLDAIHIATALATRAECLITFDRRQAEAARSFGLTVLGVDE
jgi:predicted nucleic acid-binding protein